MTKGADGAGRQGFESQTLLFLWPLAYHIVRWSWSGQIYQLFCIGQVGILSPKLITNAALQTPT